MAGMAPLSGSDLDKDEGDMDEFTDLSLPLPEPIMTTPDQDILDPAYNDGTRNLNDPRPETHLTTRNLSFDTQCNPGVNVGQEENTAQTTRKGGLAKEKAAEVSPTAGNDWIEPGPSVEELPPANCHDYSRPKRAILSPDRYRD